GARGKPEASIALASQHAPVAAIGLRRPVVHDAAAVGPDPLGRAAGLVGAGCRDDRTAGGRGMVDGGPGAARSAHGTAVLAGSGAGCAESRDVDRRVLREYNSVEGQEV